jgi:hypothetical protein
MNESISARAVLWSMIPKSCRLFGQDHANDLPSRSEGACSRVSWSPAGAVGSFAEEKGGTFFLGPRLAGAACVRGPHFCLLGYRRPILALERGFAKNNSTVARFYGGSTQCKTISLQPDLGTPLRVRVLAACEEGLPCPRLKSFRASAFSWSRMSR